MFYVSLRFCTQKPFYNDINSLSDIYALLSVDHVYMYILTFSYIHYAKISNRYRSIFLHLPVTIK